MPRNPRRTRATTAETNRLAQILTSHDASTYAFQEQGFASQLVRRPLLGQAYRFRNGTRVIKGRDQIARAVKRLYPGVKVNSSMVCNVLARKLQRTLRFREREDGRRSFSKVERHTALALSRILRKRENPARLREEIEAMNEAMTKTFLARVADELKTFGYTMVDVSPKRAKGGRVHALYVDGAAVSVDPLLGCEIGSKPPAAHRAEMAKAHTKTVASEHVAAPKEAKPQVPVYHMSAAQMGDDQPVTVGLLREVLKRLRSADVDRVLDEVRPTQDMLGAVPSKRTNGQSRRAD